MGTKTRTKSSKRGATTTASNSRESQAKSAVKPKSTRKLFGESEEAFIMCAKKIGNVGRYLNHNCNTNVFVQNVLVDTHDVRFPWVALFTSTHVGAGKELCWDYNYTVSHEVWREVQHKWLSGRLHSRQGSLLFLWV